MISTFETSVSAAFHYANYSLAHLIYKLAISFTDSPTY